MGPWRLLSLLLDYPDEELLDCSAELAETVAELPPSPAREALEAFLARRRALGASAAQREYVETFDFAKRATLYLSFHAYGDRRQRGMAMLHLKRRYREAGFELAPSTLPDHLPAMLELAELEPQTGVSVLSDFRPALEVVRAALREEESPYGPLLDTVCELLPAASERELEEAQRIAAAGPPVESVGLEPFAPPEVMPAACGVGAR
ncbi:MAG: nitrate reductase molybdenum cofactor assembly chaperone [Solirubrobacterales bacterium]